MITFTKFIILAAVAVTLNSTNQINAQEQQQRRQRGPGEGRGEGRGGGFDPEQMRQRMMERYREVLEVTGDDEWKVVSERIGKVIDARRDVAVGGMANIFGRPPGGDQGGNGGDRGGRRGFGGENLPEAEALKKALESKASADEIKTKLAKLRDARKAKEDALTKAQEDLRKVLTARQEASAVVNGLLK